MSNLSVKDQQYVWHPYQFFDASPPLPVVRAKDSTITLESGEILIDAISSWWVNIHGHCNAEITEAIGAQLSKLDHVIFSGFTHAPAVELAEKLLSVLPSNQKKIFYSDNGSTAVEIALKLAIQFWWNKGEKRKRIIALKNSYHGDTFGAMSVGFPSTWVKPFEDFLFEVHYISNPSSSECLGELENHLNSGDVCAFIFEPLVQGAGGMLMHSAQALGALVSLCKRYHVPTIADEVMTGFGRTGKWFASLHLSEPQDEYPDIMCLSKGITGGVLPLAATSCSQMIFDAFQQHDRSKTFFHGHSYTGNPISCAASVKSFELLSRPECWERIHRIGLNHQGFASTLLNHPRVQNVRSIGTILAFDVKTAQPSGYFNPVRDLIIASCRDKGVLIRPLGNTIYVLPPYCITDDELLSVYEAVLYALEKVS